MKSTAICTFSESDQTAPTFLVFNVRETCQKDLMSEKVFWGDVCGVFGGLGRVAILESSFNVQALSMFSK